MNDFVAIILARGGSKSVPKKNIKSFGDVNCLSLTINSLLTILDTKQIFVSSDCDKILQFSRDCGVLEIKRPHEFANDQATSESAWLHAIKHLESNGIDFRTVIAPQVTSPLRYENTFKKAINKFNTNKLDCLFSATEFDTHSFEWELDIKSDDIKPSNYDPFTQRERRQDIFKLPKIKENGSFYIFKKNGFLKNKVRFFGKVGHIILDKLESIEIDDNNDWNIAESVFKNNKDSFLY